MNKLFAKGIGELQFETYLSHCFKKTNIRYRDNTETCRAKLSLLQEAWYYVLDKQAPQCFTVFTF